MPASQIALALDVSEYTVNRILRQAEVERQKGHISDIDQELVDLWVAAESEEDRAQTVLAYLALHPYGVTFQHMFPLFLPGDMLSRTLMLLSSAGRANFNVWKGNKWFAE